jgi:hypothetical protein
MAEAAASGTSADADGAAGATDAAGFADTAGFANSIGFADPAGAADVEAALGAPCARAAGRSSTAKSSAYRAKKASRSPQTRAHTHEYDEDLTLGLEASATGKATARLSIAWAAYRTLGRRSHGENSWARVVYAPS